MCPEPAPTPRPCGPANPPRHAPQSGCWRVGAQRGWETSAGVHGWDCVTSAAARGWDSVTSVAAHDRDCETCAAARDWDCANCAAARDWDCVTCAVQLAAGFCALSLARGCETEVSSPGRDSCSSNSAASLLHPRAGDDQGLPRRATAEAAREVGPGGWRARPPAAPRPRPPTPDPSCASSSSSPSSPSSCPCRARASAA